MMKTNSRVVDFNYSTDVLDEHFSALRQKNSRAKLEALRLLRRNKHAHMKVLGDEATINSIFTKGKRIKQIDGVRLMLKRDTKVGV